MSNEQRRSSSGGRLLATVGWVPPACVLVLILLLSVAGLTWQTSPYWGRNAVAATPSQVGNVPNGFGPPPASTPIAPTRIDLPTLKVSAPIVSVYTDSNNELEIPLNPHIVGWWKPGARPGAAKGTAILAGHINYNGVTGSMANIGRLRPGDPVYVFGRYNSDSRKEVRFRVTGVRTYHKKTLPYRQIFDQKVRGRVAIVTCGGPFDASTGNYLDNIVVYAVPTA